VGSGRHRRLLGTTAPGGAGTLRAALGPGPCERLAWATFTRAKACGSRFVEGWTHSKAPSSAWQWAKRLGRVRGGEGQPKRAETSQQPVSLWGCPPRAPRPQGSQMPRHLVSDAHDWINEVPTVPIYCLANPQPRERRAWSEQREGGALGRWDARSQRRPRAKRPQGRGRAQLHKSYERS
jgi:hypothetical protein